MNNAVKYLLLAIVAIVLSVIIGSNNSMAQITRQNWNYILRVNDSGTSNVVSLGTSSAQFTLPRAGDPYLICSFGNTAYILCGSNPTATTSVGGFAFAVSGCLSVPVRLTGPKCAYIATSASGFLQFVHLDSTTTN